MPASRHPDQSVALKLTAAQRKAIAEFAPQFADRLKLEEPNQRIIRFTPDEVKALKEKTGAALRRATGSHHNTLQQLVDKFSVARLRPQRTRKSSAAAQVYQFKITLLNVYPPVWRRIQVEDCTLDKLHEYIQTAMGWTNSHLHHFRIKNQYYGDPLLMAENFDEFGYEDSTTPRLSDILPPTNRRFRFEYEYDFGDSWWHEILFEGRRPAEPGQRYPVCVEGERACPPEDVGGPWGYEDFVDAVT